MHTVTREASHVTIWQDRIESARTSRDFKKPQKYEFFVRSGRYWIRTSDLNDVNAIRYVLVIALFAWELRIFVV